MFFHSLVGISYLHLPLFHLLCTFCLTPLLSRILCLLMTCSWIHKDTIGHQETTLGQEIEARCLLRIQQFLGRRFELTHTLRSSSQQVTKNCCTIWFSFLVNFFWNPALCLSLQSRLFLLFWLFPPHIHYNMVASTTSRVSLMNVIIGMMRHAGEHTKTRRRKNKT